MRIPTDKWAEIDSPQKIPACGCREKDNVYSIEKDGVVGATIGVVLPEKDWRGRLVRYVLIHLNMSSFTRAYVLIHVTHLSSCILIHAYTHQMHMSSCILNTCPHASNAYVLMHLSTCPHALNAYVLMHLNTCPHAFKYMSSRIKCICPHVCRLQ